MSKDITVGAVGINETGMVIAGVLNKGSIILNKPAHLIILEKSSEKAKNFRFIALDKPDIINGFVQAKGIFCNLAEDEIMINFASILTSTDKDLFCEMWFPIHKILNIRNLVFKQK